MKVEKEQPALPFCSQAMSSRKARFLWSYLQAFSMPTCSTAFATHRNPARFIVGPLHIGSFLSSPVLTYTWIPDWNVHYLKQTIQPISDRLQLFQSPLQLQRNCVIYYCSSKDSLKNYIPKNYMPLAEKRQKRKQRFKTKLYYSEGRAVPQIQLQNLFYLREVSKGLDHPPWHFWASPKKRHMFLQDKKRKKKKKKRLRVHRLPSALGSSPF